MSRIWYCEPPLPQTVEAASSTISVENESWLRIASLFSGSSNISFATALPDPAGSCEALPRVFVMRSLAFKLPQMRHELSTSQEREQLAKLQVTSYSREPGRRCYGLMRALPKSSWRASLPTACSAVRSA